MYIKELAHERFCFSFYIKNLRDHTKNRSVLDSIIHHEIAMKRTTKNNNKTVMITLSLIHTCLMRQLFYIAYFHLNKLSNKNSINFT